MRAEVYHSDRCCFRRCLLAAPARVAASRTRRGYPAAGQPAGPLHRAEGDTLWGIAGKFLKQPWRWPEVWRMNRDQIRNPHWIYPGDVVVSIAGRRPAGGSRSMRSATRSTQSVADGPRRRRSQREAIPSIPPGDLAAVPQHGRSIARPRRPARRRQESSPRATTASFAASVTPSTRSTSTRSQATQWFIYRPGRCCARYDSNENARLRDALSGHRAASIASAKSARCRSPRRARKS